MRLVTGFAVCLVCVIATTRSAAAGPIHTPDAVTQDYFDRHSSWLSLADRNARIQPFRDHLDWLSVYRFETGRPHGRFAPLVDWDDRLHYFGVGDWSILPTWRPLVEPEQDQPAGVPEPATLLLFGVGAIAFVRGRRPAR